ncbi:MAG: CRISPR system precrRNA processing endoribonuclease RAMP protein Cas6 [Candidatus Brocadiaceae bacterium]|nr:CRISPR system precrRNA processing endoribonuclease RAMP protein Cas6 [Candidatus Brocadiaceae bacterium]
MNMLDRFTFAKFRFTIRAEEDIILPTYKGSVFRGGFGYAFKKVVCIQRAGKECSECLLHERCVYSYVFETAPPEDTERLRLYKTIPHPFVLEPPLTKDRVVRHGDRISFQLILIGRAVDYLPYFIYTFTELGKQGIGKNRSICVLEQVEGIDTDEKTRIIYTGDEEILHNRYPVLDASQLNHTDSQTDSRQIEIRFLTPCRVRYESKITDAIEFHVLFRNLLRRVSSLYYFHCGRELECDFRSFIEEAMSIQMVSSTVTWQDWERYSTRQKETMKLGGVLGSLQYEGNFRPFMQFLRLGEYIHVGKGTSFGLGQYQINSAKKFDTIKEVPENEQ